MRARMNLISFYHQQSSLARTRCRCAQLRPTFKAVLTDHR